MNKLKITTTISKGLFVFLAAYLSIQPNAIKAQTNTLYHGYTPQGQWYEDSLSYMHTALQPRSSASQDTLGSGDTLKGFKHFWHRALYKGSLYSYAQKEASVAINFLPNMSVGIEQGKTLWQNTRGFQVKGKANENVSFNLEVYENQACFPGYIDSFIFQQRAIFGQALLMGYNAKTGVYDYQYALGSVQYQKNNFSLSLANDKLFIGDGYRSLLLSDAAAPYPYLKLSYENKKIQYSAIYMQHIDAHAAPLSSILGNQKKWAVMHYLNYAISPKLHIGLFDAVVWQDADSFGKRGFDFLYANPVIFLRSSEYLTGSSDNALLGMNMKYALNAHTRVYAQFLLDECKVKEYLSNKGWWANKFGLQLGIKTAALAGISHLNAFSEINLVKPYTYSHWNSQSSYSHLNESLAHPLGANFVEWVSRIEYPYKRSLWFLQVNFSKQGLNPSDSLNNNFGSNILLSYNTHVNEYGNYIGQGLLNTVFMVNPKFLYTINPSINLRLQVEYIYRHQQNAVYTANTSIFSIGLVSGFRNLYRDR